MKSYNQRTLELWRTELRHAQSELAILRSFEPGRVGPVAMRSHERKVCNALDGVWQAQQACVCDDRAGYLGSNTHAA
jgi:hypothetical protein